MQKSYGLDWEKELEEQSRDDWIFVGSISKPCLAEIPVKDRQHYLPTGEIQRGAEDFQDCASRGPINLLSMKFTYLVGLIDRK